MDLIEIPHFDPEEFKILEGKVKVLNIFCNKTDSKNYWQDLSLDLWNVQ